MVITFFPEKMVQHYRSQNAECLLVRFQLLKLFLKLLKIIQLWLHVEMKSGQRGKLIYPSIYILL